MEDSVKVSKENLTASAEAKGKAMEAIYEGKFHEAIKHLNQAILLNPTSAIMYATRAAVYIKMNKAKAAILDANTALQINPKSSRGYKSRKMALQMLGEWEKAGKDDIHAASLMHAI